MIRTAAIVGLILVTGLFLAHWFRGWNEFNWWPFGDTSEPLGRTADGFRAPVSIDTIVAATALISAALLALGRRR